MAARIDRLVTSGTFSLDGGTWDVDNNVWIVGDDSECVVIDAAHDAEAIVAAVGERRLLAVLLTHGHDDHVNAVEGVRASTGAPVLLHEGDRMLWDAVHPDTAPSGGLVDGQVLTVAGVELEVRHTPGHTPGAVCFVAEALGTVFTGDTLFQGGPGATGRSSSDFPTIIESITERLLTLPAETVVRTGHGESTTIGAEAPHREGWIARGH
ncbi:MBL fold metallo-hydrolase [Rathayibacter rathayi]|uniref:MBL fold metallo-hydrolase n=1 Tax=Rathayibacter rathayi TaxID=33887 RepID=UPI000BD7D019|nr:MBL fold metallo-hydrolase [Rathayibacter rathayi]AZZ49736.1 MBL fold metallo-hydrolase [Rathayibacter rathayi]MWV75410.1 MBL fold metallo-hydrolase [Rathayibacter rathayi NCPPB 2980 = VKM Ac-1601]PPF46603.1 MBL fold metallo-hydrolase [Rathayibacter rathayi]PPG66803.1 MBL fold metallo-hydrolase [Rathayibacter rathayi]PPG68417.1 MBL fold metallo-hydrolase [Rathayibacter rathayi]